MSVEASFIDAAHQVTFVPTTYFSLDLHSLLLKEKLTSQMSKPGCHKTATLSLFCICIIVSGYMRKLFCMWKRLLIFNVIKINDQMIGYWFTQKIFWICRLTVLLKFKLGDEKHNFCDLCFVHRGRDMLNYFSFAHTMYTQKFRFFLVRICAIFILDVNSIFYSLCLCL